MATSTVLSLTKARHTYGVLHLNFPAGMVNDCFAWYAVWVQPVGLPLASVGQYSNLYISVCFGGASRSTACAHSWGVSDGDW